MDFDAAFARVIEGNCPNVTNYGEHQLENGWCPEAKQEGGLFWSAFTTDGGRILFTNWRHALLEIEQGQDDDIAYIENHGWELRRLDGKR